MNTKMFLVDMAITVPVTFIVAAVVTYLYSLIAHGAGVVDWAEAVYLAFVIGLVLPLTRARNGKDAKRSDSPEADQNHRKCCGKQRRNQ